ncbi:L-arabinonate dehydratase [Aquincola tertiaricarbonis]|uniref:L-arabinonate dehydratase n=1 Tax=Aquincola tertiaricarbonis TaxID=391953 RepID=A0ABY4S5F6_AQUTE|nr:L-arabinonate dehydratase [Aquincola tertiaricarbonis]URI08224.1 L-arabinonate dehydratase [Aquincola tertiaricarbonis]
MPPRKTLADLRSRRWFAATDMRAFAHRQRMQQMGLRREDVLDHPIIAIVNTWSDLSPCHAHLRERAESVKRGVLMAGGMPFELPAMSLGEVMVKPTTMLYRNFLAMEVEELLRSLPIDGVVLLAGCDKTTPATVMGAISAGLPTLFCAAGPMLSDRYLQPGQPPRTVGAGTHTRMFWDEYQAGHISEPEWVKLEAHMTRAPGTCNTMGTASTMTAIVEALGLALPGSTAIPAMDAGHTRMATSCGERIVGLVWEDLKPADLLTPGAFRNAAVVQMALGGSTNAAVHLLAMARRAGVALTLDDLDAIARQVPVLANLFPSGDRLMEDFHYAGGLPALMDRVRAHLSLGEMTVTGRTLGENIDGRHSLDDETIRPLDRPVSADGALAVVRGNLAPDGAVMKVSAASPQLLCHEGRALVFDSPAEMVAQCNDPALDCDETTVMVLRYAGPVGAPGMPEWGGLPIPKKLLARGVRDMVRISDARMSGTHYGSCVLHVSPEAAVGGPLALVRTGDRIRLDVPARSLQLLVPDEELAQRRAAWQPPPPAATRGYTRLYQQHVTQAHEGCDFDFLQGPGPNPEPAIF